MDYMHIILIVVLILYIVYNETLKIQKQNSYERRIDEQRGSYETSLKDKDQFIISIQEKLSEERAKYVLESFAIYQERINDQKLLIDDLRIQEYYDKNNISIKPNSDRKIKTIIEDEDTEENDYIE